ncbi:hypothetical protein BBP40_011894, partial [Aspergillus hancockii]
MHSLQLIAGLLLSAPTITSLSIPNPFSQQFLRPSSPEICPLAPKVSSPDDGLLAGLRFVEDKTIRSRQAHRLSKAVQVPTTVTDYMKDPYDPGFSPFLEFHDLLEELFPLT